MGKYNTKENTKKETDIPVKRDQDVCHSGLVTINTNVEGLLGCYDSLLKLRAYATMEDKNKLIKRLIMSRLTGNQGKSARKL